MARQPPIHELEFLRITVNHGEFTRKLQTLIVSTSQVTEYAQHVGACWFRLAETHLAEGDLALAAGCTRTIFSRAYYAAYNASKAVRYIAQGAVSLKADDHQRAAELPSTFPDYARWGRRITTLYENRLRADYDNWSTTAADFSLTPNAAAQEAAAFLTESRKYLNGTYGMAL